jgi:ribosomal protein S18 acetylase RimI-like enzyme
MQSPTQYLIRPLTPDDQDFLWEMLYHSLYVPSGSPPFDRSILDYRAIARYVKDWGREHDAGFVAEDGNGQLLGSVWLRLLVGEERGYGYINDQTPEIGIAVLPEYRGQGIGTMLLSGLIDSVEGEYEGISLSVATENPARRLYERLGFAVVNQQENSVVLQKCCFILQPKMGWS